MDLLSFLWLWKVAAWSMGLTSLTYIAQGISGYWLYRQRSGEKPRPNWLKPLHYGMGIIMVLLILLLLTIGVVGTIGHYGRLGHSPHLLAGLMVVILALISAVSANMIGPEHPQARSLHVKTNIILFLALLLVSLTGWRVVQQYLP